MAARQGGTFRLLLVLVLCSLAKQLRPALAQQGFLQEQLPLKPLVSTPSELLTQDTEATVTLTGRQAITVVFSRPVIALGSDFGIKDLPEELVPFTLSCNTPGRLRWVTTNIARFDPSVDWPTDLSCSFKWNAELKAFDGTPLDLDGNAAAVKLSTVPLDMSLSDVQSEAAMKATDGLWSATAGLPDDGKPEVPPGANITLSFSYPVDLAKLSSVLQIVAAKAGDSISSKIAVLPCTTVSPMPRPIIMLGMDDTSKGTSKTDLLAKNATCAVVQLNPPLPTATGAILRLPQGARYSALAGPVRKNADVKLFGLRKFRIPFRQDWSKADTQDDQIVLGTSSRRLDLWLPHGLASGVEPSQLKPLISICRFSLPGSLRAACAPLTYGLTRPSKGKLRMSVPAMDPRQQFRVTVQGSSGVKDAFGLPLQPSSAVFWSKNYDDGMVGPDVNGKDVVIFEVAPGAATLTWPFVSRGKPGGARTAQQWKVAEDDVPKLLGNLLGYMGTPGDAFGQADASLVRSSQTSPNFQSLKLPGGSSMSLSGVCCIERGYGSTRGLVLSGEALVLQSNLQAAFVGSEGDLTAWITNSQAAGGPVEGAKVTLYFQSNNQGPSTSGPSCTTAADGTCTIDSQTIADGRSFNGMVSAMVTAEGQGPLVVPQISVAPRYQQAEAQYKAAVVLDRPLVKPGDSLHVTGYIQRLRGAQLLPPAGLGSVLVQITPNFNPAVQTPLLLTATVDADFGTVHLPISVPSSAPPASYSISILTPSEGAAPGGVRRLHAASAPSPKPAPASPKAATKAAAPATGSSTSAGGAAAAAATPFAPRGLPPVVPPPGAPAGSSEGYSSAGAADFTVADPRPPTAALTVTVPKWSKPNAKVEVQLAARSYVGTQVAGAPITLSWTLPRANGEIQVTTDADGKANATIDLRDLPPFNQTGAGDNLEVKATWIGPTRENIVQTATVSMANGPVRVELSRTLETDLPGVRFGVAADVYSNEDGTRQKGVGVTLTVAPANTSDGATNCSAKQLADLKDFSCSIKSEDTIAAAKACQLALPCAGAFSVKGCVGESCNNFTLGRNASEWASYPWNSQPKLTVLTDKPTYSPGDEVGLVLQNPYWGDAAALVVWGNRLQRKQKTFEKVPAGLVNLTIGPIGTECRGGCQAVVTLAVARPAGGKAAQALPDVPTSLLFDPLAPHTPTGAVTIEVPETSSVSCNVTVSSGAMTVDGDAVVEANKTADITVTVTGTDGTPLEGAEVTIVVVDKAILDLMPYELQNVSSQMQPGLAAQFDQTTLDAFRATWSAVNSTFSVLQRRLKLDPYLPLYTGIQPTGYYSPVFRGWGEWQPILPTPSPVDVPDSTYLADHTSQITYFPNDFSLISDIYGPSAGISALAFGIAAPRPAPMPAMPMADGMAMAKSARGAGDEAMTADAAGNSGGGARAQAAAPASLRLQSDFRTTALFAVAKTGADGAATVSFRAPPNLGTFVVRAYVASPPDGDAATRYGAGESSVVVRRTVSLVPSAPRIVRSGDAFEAGVVVTSPGSTEPVTVTVVASAQAAGGGANGTKGGAKAVSLQSGKGSDSSTVEVAAGGQQEVRFKFSAKQVGNGSLTFVATAGGASAAASASDAVQIDVPVLGRQSDVYIATSFAVRPNASSGASSTRQEGLLLPKAENGTGSLDLLAGVGYLPAIQATFESLYSQVKGKDYEPSGILAISVATLPAMLALYRPEEAPKAWLTGPQVAASLRGIDDALGPLTDSSFGLMYSDPTKYGAPADRCPVSLNAWASWIVRQLEPPKGDAGFTKRWADLDAATDKWRAALASQVIKDARAAREAQPEPFQYDDLDTLSWARLALGSRWKPDGQTEQIAGDLAFSRLTGAWKNLTVGGQARVGLVLQEDKGDQDVLSAILKSLQGSMRVAGRTAYLASGPGERSAASLADNSLALKLFVGAGLSPSSNPLVQKLAAYIAQGPARSSLAPLCISVGGFDSALSALALSRYDKATQSTQPDLALNATAAGNYSQAQLLSAKFTASNAGSLKRSSTPWSKVPPGARLGFSSRGRGEVSVAASLNFVPAEVLPFPTYRGLWVQRIVQLREGGGSVIAAPLASTVTVVVQVTTPDDLQDVVVEVMMPGGLEPLDPNVYKDPDAATVCGQSQDEQDVEDIGGGDSGGPIPLEGRPFGGRPVAMPRRRLASWRARGAAAAPRRRLMQSAKRGGGFLGMMFRLPWPVCPAQETLPAAVKLRYSFLSAGSHSIKLKAIAATPGTFVLPPVKVYVAQQPEVMGLSAGGKFKVCGARAAACDTSDQPPAPAPKRCAEDCNRNGVCNLAAGKCICDAGFTGATCDKIAPVSAV